MSDSLSLTKAEQLIIWMLADIQEKLGMNEDEPAFIKDAIGGGHHWALEWQFQGLFGERVDESIAREVIDILDVWYFIEEAEPGTKFPGFDGNHEGDHLSAATLLTGKMRRFESFKDRLGHGVHGLARYRGMVERFKPMRAGLADRRKLTTAQIDELLSRRKEA